MKKITIIHLQNFLKENGYSWKKEIYSENTQSFIKAKKFYQICSSYTNPVTLKLYEGKKQTIGTFVINSKEFEKIETIEDHDTYLGCTVTDLKSAWKDFLSKKGFKTQIRLGDVSQEDYKKFVSSINQYIPAHYRGIEPHISVICDYKQYVLFTFKTGNSAYILYGNRDGEIAGSYTDSFVIQKNPKITSKWNEFIKEQDDDLLASQI